LTISSVGFIIGVKTLENAWILMKRREPNSYANSYVRRHFAIIIAGGVLLAFAIIAFSIFMATRLSNFNTQMPVLTAAQQNEGASKFIGITIDMNYADMIKLIGRPGELQSPPTIETTPNPVPRLPGNSYRWNFDEDGRISLRAYLGTEDKIHNLNFISSYVTISKTTASKYNRVKGGMTYDQVVSILGSPGTLKSAAKVRFPGPIQIGKKSPDRFFTSENYTWYEEDSSTTKSIAFVDGLVRE
jgi:hypothetical protein